MLLLVNNVLTEKDIYKKPLCICLNKNLKFKHPNMKT